jgi:Phage portal protein
VSFWSRMNADYAKRQIQQRAPRPSSQNAATGYGRQPPEEQPPGGFSFGTSWFGGPYYTDPFQSRRAPSPFALIEKYQTLVYAMVARKRDAVSKVPLRLYADGSRAQGGKPRSACDPIRVSRSVGERLAKNGAKISPAAVDQIYEIRNHPIIDVLDKPDPYGYFDRKKLIGLICAYQDVVGSAFLIPDGMGWDWRSGKKRNGPFEFLWVVYPQYVIPVRYGSTPLINYWQYFRDYLPFESTIWFRQSLSLRDAYGSAFSPTYAGDLYADQEGRFIAIYDQILGLGPRPNMIASAKDPMMPPTDIQMKRLEQDMQRRQAGGNAGGLHVNSGAFEFTPVSYSPTDMGGKELAEYDRNCLAAIFGVPPTYFTTETNLANLQAAGEYFARFGVTPMCDSIASTLTSLVRQWDPRLHFAFDPVIAEDELQKAQCDKIYVDMGAITLNQLNEEKKYPKVPWGDEPWLPSTLKQPSMMIAEHEQGLEQGQAAIEQGEAKAESQQKRDDFELRDEPDTERAVLIGRELMGLQRRLAG